MAVSITGLPSAVTEGSSYGVTLAGVTSDTVIYWRIVPSGKLPVSLSDFNALTGSFTAPSGSTSFDVDLGFAPDSLAEYEKSFTIYFSLSDLSTTSNPTYLGSQEVILTDKMAGSAAASSTISYGGSGVADIVTLGGNSQSSPNALAGNDYYIVTRYQYGDVMLGDTQVSNGGKNVLKFDYGVEITHFLISEARHPVLPITIINSLEITLKSGAVITVNNPNTAYEFQFGDEETIDYGALKEKLLGDSNANLANANTGKLTTAHKIGSDVKFADFTYSEGAAASSISYVASSVADLVTLGSNSQSSPNALAGNDYYVVTRYQYGDVMLGDTQVSNGGKNVLKFDYGVEITHFLISEARHPVLPITIINSLEITLKSGAVITVNNPNTAYEFQFGDEDAIDYGALKEKLLGDSNANLANANTGKLTKAHKIDFPSPEPVTLADGAAETLTDKMPQGAEDNDAIYYIIGIDLAFLKSLFVIDNTQVPDNTIDETDFDIFHNGQSILNTNTNTAHGLEYTRSAERIIVGKFGANFNGDIDLKLVFSFSYKPVGASEAIDDSVEIDFTINVTPEADDLPMLVTGVALGSLQSTNKHDGETFDRASADADRDFLDNGGNKDIYYYVKDGTTYLLKAPSLDISATASANPTGQAIYLAQINSFTDLKASDFKDTANLTLTHISYYGTAFSTDASTTTNMPSDGVKQIHIFSDGFDSGNSGITITGYNATTDEIRLIEIARHTANVSISGDDVLITLNNGTPDNTGDDKTITLSGLAASNSWTDAAAAEAALTIIGEAEDVGTIDNVDENKTFIGSSADIDKAGADNAIDLSALFTHADGNVTFTLTGTHNVSKEDIAVDDDGVVWLLGDDGKLGGDADTDTNLRFDKSTGLLTKHSGGDIDAGIYTFTVTATGHGLDGKLDNDDKTISVSDVIFSIKTAPTAAFTTEGTGKAGTLFTNLKPASILTEFGIEIPDNLLTINIEFVDKDNNVLEHNPRDLFPDGSGFTGAFFNRPEYGNLLNLPLTLKVPAEGFYLKIILIDDKINPIATHYVRAFIDNPITDETNAYNLYHVNFNYSDEDTGDDSSFAKLLFKLPTSGGSLLYRDAAIDPNNLHADITIFDDTATDEDIDYFVITAANIQYLKFDRGYYDGELSFQYKVEDVDGRQSDEATATIDFGDRADEITLPKLDTAGEAAALAHKITGLDNRDDSNLATRDKFKIAEDTINFFIKGDWVYLVEKTYSSLATAKFYGVLPKAGFATNALSANDFVGPEGSTVTITEVNYEVALPTSTVTGEAAAANVEIALLSGAPNGDTAWKYRGPSNLSYFLKGGDLYLVKPGYSSLADAEFYGVISGVTDIASTDFIGGATLTLVNYEIDLPDPVAGEANAPILTPLSDAANGDTAWKYRAPDNINLSYFVKNGDLYLVKSGYSSLADVEFYGVISGVTDIASTDFIGGATLTLINYELLLSDTATGEDSARDITHAVDSEYELADEIKELWYYEKNGKIYFMQPASGKPGASTGSYYAAISGLAAADVLPTLFKDRATSDLVLTKATIASPSTNARDYGAAFNNGVIIFTGDAFSSATDTGFVNTITDMARNISIYFPDITLDRLSSKSLFGNTDFVFWVLDDADDTDEPETRFRIDLDIDQSTTIITKEGFEIKGDWHVVSGSASTNDTLAAHATKTTAFFFIGTDFGDDVITGYESGDKIFLSDIDADDIEVVYRKQFTSEVNLVYPRGTLFGSYRYDAVIYINKHDMITSAKIIIENVIENVTVTLDVNRDARGDTVFTIFGEDGEQYPADIPKVVRDISGTDASDTLFGRFVYDAPNAHKINETIRGGGGNDTIWGANGNDILLGEAGNDTIYLAGFNIEGRLIIDYRIGSEGNNDVASGGVGRDKFILDPTSLGFSDFGNDRIVDYTDGEIIEYHDLVQGKTLSEVLKLSVRKTGDGYNLLVDNDDEVDGDVLTIENIKVEIVAEGTMNSFAVDGADEHVLIKTYLPILEDGNWSLFLTIPGDNNDAGESAIIIGTENDDELFGFTQNDTLTGNDGDDILRGHAGNDTLDGGAGHDTITGGAGDDKFVLHRAANTKDTVKDFRHSGQGNDKIVIEVTQSQKDSFDSAANNLVAKLGALGLTSVERVEKDVGTSAADTVIMHGGDVVMILQDFTGLSDTHLDVI